MSTTATPDRIPPGGAGPHRLHRRRAGSGHRPGRLRRCRPDVRLDEPRLTGPDAPRPGGPGSGAGAARSSGARARRPATASTSAACATTATATCCWWRSTRRAPVRATPATGRASSAPSATRSDRHGARPGTGPSGPGIDGFRLLGRQAPHRAGMARAGGRHPHPGGRLPPDRRRSGPDRVPSRVGGGRGAVGPLLVRGPQSAGHHHRPRLAGHHRGAGRPRRPHRWQGERRRRDAGGARGHPRRIRIPRPPRPAASPRRSGRLPRL